MIYVFNNGGNGCSVVFAEETLNEQQKIQGVAIKEMPKIEHMPGKVAVLRCDRDQNTVWYDYEDAPIDEIAALKEQLAAQQSAINMLLGV